MDTFIRNYYIPSIRSDVLAVLEKSNVSQSTLKGLEQCFENHSKVFEPVSSEHRRFTILKTEGYEELEEFLVGIKFVEKLVGNDIKLVPENLYGVHIPLQKSLKKFLEIRGLLNKILEYVNKLSKESKIIKNIMQADLWKNKYSKKLLNDIVLPLYIFYDELETGNPLGSHAGKNKFGAIYASIACLPPEIAARLSSIIFYGLIRAEEKKYTNNKNVFSRLIDE